MRIGIGVELTVRNIELGIRPLQGFGDLRPPVVKLSIQNLRCIGGDEEGFSFFLISISIYYFFFVFFCFFQICLSLPPKLPILIFHSPFHSRLFSTNENYEVCKFIDTWKHNKKQKDITAYKLLTIESIKVIFHFFLEK